MKKKNLLVLCSAAGLCLICALLLAGSMGIYAEKSGTKEFEPEIAESETSDTLTRILTENNEQNDVQEEGLIPEETLKEIWEKMYEEYAGAEEMQKEIEEQNAEARSDAESLGVVFDTEAEFDGADLKESDPVVTLDTAELGVHEAGLILLKEINRLYPKDTLEDLKIERIAMECDVGMNGQGFIEWEGRLETDDEINDKNYRSYQFEIDSVTGKIVSFGKFRPYQKDKDYTDITWTDDEVRAHAKELIEKYDLAAGEELDWNELELYNGTEPAASLKQEFEEEPDVSTAIGNTLIFKKDGKKIFYLSLDWETGEISDYIWPGRSMPE